MMKLLDNIRNNTIFLLLVTAIVLYIILRDDFDGIDRIKADFGAFE